MSEDISATSGTFAVSGSAVHCVPSMVLLVQNVDVEASARIFISSRRGRRGKPFRFGEGRDVMREAFFSIPQWLWGPIAGMENVNRLPKHEVHRAM